MILTAGLDTVLAHRRQVAERFRRAGLTLLAEQPSAACTAALLPGNIDLIELQGGLFAAARMVVATGSTPEGATTLQFGHNG